MIIFTHLKLTWKLPVWVENPAFYRKSKKKSINISVFEDFFQSVYKKCIYR